MELTTQIICQVVLDLHRELVLYFVENSGISSFFPLMRMSSTYMMIMHIPSSFSLNSMHGSAGLTVNQRVLSLLCPQISPKIALLLGISHICLLVVDSSPLMMILVQFVPFQPVTSPNATNLAL